MNEMTFEKDKFLKEIERVFGAYKAEWSGDDIFHHFTTPSYFFSLEAFHPCVLQGGRGSGKTTALKGLSYLGQYELRGCKIDAFDKDVGYIGLYQCIDTNHVRSFVGANISIERWEKYFGHYFNLIVALELAVFLNWHLERNDADEKLSSAVLRKFLELLGISNHDCESYEELQGLIEEELYRFQGVINNVQYWEKHSDQNYLSSIGDPIRYFVERVLTLNQYKGKHVFIIVDEYENLEDYQQVLLNTLLKHSRDLLTFKIGVRELGWRTKHTRNKDELLYDPADYKLLDIRESFAHGMNFSEFARTVCQKRFDILFKKEGVFDVTKALLGMTPEDEAVTLGVEEHELMKGFDLLPDSLKSEVVKLPALYRFAMAYWADSRKLGLADVVMEYLQDRETWNVRYENYKYHLLFKINIGRGSGKMQKYYCGFETYVKLASCNIRFLMELVHNAYVAHIEDGFRPMESVSATIQTNTAKRIGIQNLTQIESESGDGSRIVRMLMGLGRVFELLAKDKSLGQPEVNQFYVDGLENDAEMLQIVNTAVKNLALERTSGSKLSGFETKAFEYNVHPIFAPHFSYSYRRKRKMGISLDSLRLMTINPRDAVRQVLNKRLEQGCGMEGNQGEVQMELGL